MKNYRKNISLLAIIAGLTLQPGASLAQTATGTAVTGMKWHPGHYIMNNISVADIDKLLFEFKDIPSFRGIERTYDWRDLEVPKVGGGWRYDFSQIDQDLAKAKKYNKKLSIMLGYKYIPLPKYVTNFPNTTINGVVVRPYYPIKSDADGQHANFGHPDTLKAFNNLLKALANKYDTDPSVSFIRFAETSSSAEQISDAQETNFLNGIMNMQVKARAAFLHTPLIQNLNFPRNRLADFIKNATTLKMGFGGPDTFWGAFDNPGDGLTTVGTQYTAQGIYRYYPAAKGVLPIGMQVHRGNLIADNVDNLRAEIYHNLPATTSVQKVYEFSRDKLYPNYIAWQVFGAGDEYRIALREKLKKNLFPLETVCPTVYNNTCQQ